MFSLLVKELSFTFYCPSLSFGLVDFHFNVIMSVFSSLLDNTQYNVASIRHDGLSIL